MFQIISQCYICSKDNNISILCQMIAQTISSESTSRTNQLFPIIDLKSYQQDKSQRKRIAQMIRKACKEIGFFYVSNHGVPKKLQSQIFEQMDKFFKLTVQQKKTIDITKYGINWKGYLQQGFEYTGQTHDQRQAVWYGRELSEQNPNVKAGLPLHGRNPFPQNMPNFKKAILQWLYEMDRVGRILSMAFAQSLGLDIDFFTNGMCKDHLGSLGVLHYPKQEIIKESNWGVSQHTDYGFFTMLMFDQPRLQVQDVKGNWIQVQPIPDTFVVNIADILEIMTKGLYKSTPHRVRNYSNKSRYSLAYFYDMNWHAKIQPLDFQINKEEQQIILKVKNYKRWDQAFLHETKGIFGHYYIRKLMDTFPLNLQKEFAAFLQK